MFLHWEQLMPAELHYLPTTIAIAIIIIIV